MRHIVCHVWFFADLSKRFFFGCCLSFAVEDGMAGGERRRLLSHRGFAHDGIDASKNVIAWRCGWLQECGAQANVVAGLGGLTVPLMDVPNARDLEIPSTDVIVAVCFAKLQRQFVEELRKEKSDGNYCADRPVDGACPRISVQCRVCPKLKNVERRMRG